MYWPCNFVIYLGYFLAPFCFGASLVLPYICIKDAKQNLLETMNRMNILKLKEKGLSIVYRQSCSTSWFEISVITNERNKKDEEAGNHPVVMVEEIVELPDIKLLGAGGRSSSSGEESHKLIAAPNNQPPQLHNRDYLSGSTGAETNNPFSGKLFMCLNSSGLSVWLLKVPMAAALLLSHS